MKIFNKIYYKVKNIIILLSVSILAIITLSACSTKQECIPVIKIQKEYVPVAIKLDKPIVCDFNTSSRSEYVKSLLDCIGIQKKAIEALQDDSKATLPLNLSETTK
jgi:hypothetical protein